MIKKLVCVLAALLVLVSSSSAHAALNAYIKIKGKTGAFVLGGVTQKGREGSSVVVATSHEIISPRDPASGLPTGKRMHKPFVVTMEIDKALPLLLKSLTTNENLPEVSVAYWRANAVPNGTEQQFYTVKLTNANIASISFRQPNTMSPDLRAMPEYVEVAFTYQKITWTWTDGNITAGDDWAAPVN